MINIIERTKAEMLELSKQDFVCNSSPSRVKLAFGLHAPLTVVGSIRSSDLAVQNTAGSATIARVLPTLWEG